MRRDLPIRQRRQIDQQKLDELRVPHIQPFRPVRIEVDHPQLDVADSLFLELCDRILAGRLEPDRKIQLRLAPYHPVLNIAQNTFCVLLNTAVIQHRSKKVPIPHLRAPDARHPVESALPDLTLFQIRGVQNRAGRSQRDNEPVVHQHLGSQRHIKVVLKFPERTVTALAGLLRIRAKRPGVLRAGRAGARLARLCLAPPDRFVLRPQQLIRKRIIVMDPRKGHHILSVTPGEVISVLCFDPLVSFILRHRDIRFIPDIGRIGKRPQKLRLRHRPDRLPD